MAWAVKQGYDPIWEREITHLGQNLLGNPFGEDYPMLEGFRILGKGAGVPGRE